MRISGVWKFPIWLARRGALARGSRLNGREHSVKNAIEKIFSNASGPECFRVLTLSDSPVLTHPLLPPEAWVLDDDPASFLARYPCAAIVPPGDRRLADPGRSRHQPLGETALRRARDDPVRRPLAGP